MRYVSPFSDADLYAELLGDLSGLTVGSAFLLSSEQQAQRILKLCDTAAKEIYDEAARSGKPAEVQCITLDAGGFIGFDCLKPLAALPDNAAVVPVYRYFDTPREAMVGVCIMSPHEIEKTREVTFFCGPDRRKTGDYRIFSIHPGPKRQIFPSRYQPEAVRRENREYWDRHVFLATPNQVLTARALMRANYRNLDPEAKDRVFHTTRQMEAALHRWYGTWEQQQKRPDDIKSILAGQQTFGDFGMDTAGSVYYFTVSIGQPPPDVNDRAQVEPLLGNPHRPSIIHPNGGEEYFMNGKRHRLDGPAVIQPEPDGGWIELWYEEGLLSRSPEEGAAKIIYNSKGEVIHEVSYYKGAEVEQTVLGDAAEPIKLIQQSTQEAGLCLRWWEESQDFMLLRSQIEFAVSRTKAKPEEVVRHMRPDGEQVNLRWDFDRTLEQDAKVKEDYDRLAFNVAQLATRLVEGSQAMRFVRGDSNIVNTIWAKVLREFDRVLERALPVPAIEPGKSLGDTLVKARDDAKRYFQSMEEQGKAFSATGR